MPASFSKIHLVYYLSTLLVELPVLPSKNIHGASPVYTDHLCLEHTLTWVSVFF